MLKTIDILLGLSLVMLVVSMAVTVLTQFATNLVNTRGRHLRRGLADLLAQIDPTLAGKIADEIAGRVLTHPLIRETMGRLGAVIHREELTKLLLELAAGSGPQTLEPIALAALKKALAGNGVSDPEAALKNIRQVALALEISNPALANNARLNLAILHEAASDFVAKVNAWFDQTIDRVIQRFTFHARWVTFVNAILVAFLLQLDTFAVVNRLSVDESLRNSLVEQAQQISQNQPGNQADLKYDRFLASRGLITIPQSPQDWADHMGWPKLPGIVLSAMLLSLGAPFWYNALKNLLRLRSVLAAKDDDQRRERQSSQADGSTPAGPAPAPPDILRGERGDLAAAG